MESKTLNKFEDVLFRWADEYSINTHSDNDTDSDSDTDEVTLLASHFYRIPIQRIVIDVGMPVSHAGARYNCRVIIMDGKGNDSN